MNHTNFKGVDLNLFVVFAALMQTGNTTRAAKTLFITQPAVSHALKRLRILLKDELFVRSSHGLVPTPRAQSVWGELVPAMAQLEGLVSGAQAFEPAGAERVFRIGLPSAVDVCLTPKLLAAFAKQAPRVNLVVRPTSSRDVPDQLDRDEVDVALTVISEVKPWHVKEAISTHGYLCLFDGKRLRIRPPISLERFLALPHILMSFSGDRHGVVDEALEKRKLKRRVLVAAADIASAAIYLKCANALAVLPEYAARRFAESLGLTISPVPITIAPMTLSIAWHSRYNEDAATRWFRELARVAALEI